jgi:hypothetical protein
MRKIKIKHKTHKHTQPETDGVSSQSEEAMGKDLCEAQMKVLDCCAFLYNIGTVNGVNREHVRKIIERARKAWSEIGINPPTIEQYHGVLVAAYEGKDDLPRIPVDVPSVRVTTDWYEAAIEVLFYSMAFYKVSTQLCGVDKDGKLLQCFERMQKACVATGQKVPTYEEYCESVEKRREKRKEV